MTSTQRTKLVLGLAGALIAGAPKAADATLVHQWTFLDGTANDSIGDAHGVLQGDAHISGGKLVLDGDGDWVLATGTPSTLESRTLVSWVTLNNFTHEGGVLGVRDGSVFDAIVIGERTQGQWMNGSNDWSRSGATNNGGAIENDTGEIMIAIAYQSLGGGNQAITIYRNGVSYATYGTAESTFEGDEFYMGIRNSEGDYMGGYLNGSIHEARVYDEALSAGEIASLFSQGPAVPEPASLALMGFGGLLLLRRRR